MYSHRPGGEYSKMQVSTPLIALLRALREPSVHTTRTASNPGRSVACRCTTARPSLQSWHRQSAYLVEVHNLIRNCYFLPMPSPGHLFRSWHSVNCIGGSLPHGEHSFCTAVLSFSYTYPCPFYTLAILMWRIQPRSQDFEKYNQKAK